MALHVSVGTAELAAWRHLPQNAALAREGEVASKKPRTSRLLQLGDDKFNVPPHTFTSCKQA